MGSFLLNVTFSAPAIFGRRSNLPGVLAALLVEECRERGMGEAEAIDYAHANIPLSEYSGIQAGSSALIPRCPTHVVTFINSLQRHVISVPNFADYVQPAKQVRKNSRRFEGLGTPVMRSFQVADIHSEGAVVRYAGHGDVDEVERIMRRADFLGKKGSSGAYGKIKSLWMDRLPDNPLTGIVSENGTVMRPIPKQVGESLPAKHYGLAFESVTPPFWKSEKMLCCVPPQTMWDEDEICDLIGVA